MRILESLYLPIVLALTILISCASGRADVPEAAFELGSRYQACIVDACLDDANETNETCFDNPPRDVVESCEHIAQELSEL